MTSDAAIIERLREAAERVDVDLTLEEVVAAPGPQSSHRPDSRRLAPAVAACLLLVVGLAVAASIRFGTNDAVQPASSWSPPVSAPVGAPGRGEVAAHVAIPPDWVGELVPGWRDGALRSGRWVSVAIGRPTSEGFASPITVSVFDGAWTVLDAASSVEIDGHTYLHLVIGEWQTLVTTTEPAIAASGRVDRDTLHGVLVACSVVTSSSDFSIALGSLPSGYVEMIRPHRLGTDTTPRRALAEVGGVLVINEASDLAHPLLAAATSGADLTRHEVGSSVGWSGTTSDNPYGPITFLFWSPEAGVVFEIDSTDMARPIEDLVELARATTAIGAAEWDTRYPS
jgi:hypothetical protein